MQRPAIAEESSPTRVALLDAAERLLARIGYRKVTMEDLAQEAGVSRRTVYGYFRNKEEVILGTIDRIVERVSARLAVVARSEGSAAERLRDMLVERVRIRVENVRDYAHALDEIFAALRPAYLERRKAYFEAEAELLAGVLRQGQRAGEFARRDARETALLLLTATNAFLPHGLSPAQLQDTAGTLNQLGALAELLVGGLRPGLDRPRLPSKETKGRQT
ncbi:MAG: TetR/AcrR family transcriptional regulator [Myxococcaceae bacterium]|nr:TetR/AcrR family transcriptional regulator [Myxococcaceae bacterium]